MLLGSIADNWQGWAILSGLVFGTYLTIVWLAATYWTYKDISARTRDAATQLLMTLLVLVFFLPGLILYLIIRPKVTLTERYDRQLEAEALLRELQEDPTCPFCRRKIGADFLICPYCRTALGASCSSCSRVLSFSWVLCPYCGAERQVETPQIVEGRGSASGAAVIAPAVQASEAPTEDGVTPRPIRQRRAPTAKYTPPAAASSATGEPLPAPAPAPATPDAAMDPGASV